MHTVLRGNATHTASGEPRGHIDFSRFRQLWVHTGTACNLHCPSCFEQAGPGDSRLQPMTLALAGPFLDEAARLGVESFGFTGGEPFVNRDLLPLLEYALRLAPCLVLSNGTEPLQSQLDRLRELAAANPGALSIRISLDYPCATRHDAQRGPGCIAMALHSLRLLLEAGLTCTVARRLEDNEDTERTAATYAALFTHHGLPANLPLVAFPDLQNNKKSPEISEKCIQTYHTPQSCAAFMCAHSRMLVQQHGVAKLYACTLVDNDPGYDLGSDLAGALKARTLLRHKRCFNCFACGVSCAG